MKRVACFLIVTSSLIWVASPAHAASGSVVLGIWPQTYAQFLQIEAASGMSIPYFRARQQDGQFDRNLVGPDEQAAAAAGYSLGMNIQPKTGTGSNRTGILYTDISAQIQAGSGPYYDKLVSFAQEVLALPTYGRIPNYLQFHSEASTQSAPGVQSAQPYSGTAAQYQQCYALVHQLFESLGVTNKIYWQMVLDQGTYAGGQGGAAAWYPTDPSTYDLVGVDGYYHSPNWISPTTAFGPAVAFAQAQGKQIWIDETGADEGGPTNSATAKAAWYASLESFIEANGPSVAGVVFSNAMDGGNWFFDSKLSGGRTVPNYTGTSWNGWTSAVRALATDLPSTNTLSMTTTGSGGGGVTSLPAGINCPTTCSASFLNGASVTLSATPAGGSTFTGWSGACSGAVTTCTVTVDAAKSVNAQFVTQDQLSVSTSGNGNGTITSDSGGIACPSTCSANYAPGATVTLTATPGANSVFTGWSGSGISCPGTGTCQVTMNADTTVSATFTQNAQTLNLTYSGTGGGTVTSAPTGIDCTASCSGSFPAGTPVTLTSAPSANSVFTGWSGDCAGTSTCPVTMSTAHNVTATFTLVQHALFVTKSGTGTGTVASVPGGISCGATCSANYDHGSTVALTATPAAGSSLTGWSGDCSGTAATCTVTVDAAKSVNAQFDLIPRQLSVTVAGTGSVASDTGGIGCPGVCGATFPNGTVVTLTATPGAGYGFSAWSGGGCTGTGTCQVTMNADTTVTATFTPILDPVNVTLSGSGGGIVTSTPSGITCSTGTCSANFSQGSQVTLTAAPNANSVFSAWSGGVCSGVVTTCSLTMDAAKSVTATFTLVLDPVSVNLTGSGSGGVTSNPAGISCSTTCSANFNQGSAITLTAAPNANSVFTGWSGACTGTAATCTLTVDAAKSLNAQFDLTPRQLSVTVAGTGSVASNTGGIGCPGVCGATFPNGTVVTLTPTPGTGYGFSAWSGGGCTGTGTCQVTMNADTTVTATFTPILDPVNVTLSGSGGGTVTSNPAGITCSTGTCSGNFNQGSQITLTAAPNANSVFTGWTGDCSGTTNPCPLTVNAVKNATATFTPIPRQLSVSVVGTGSAASNTGGIICPSSCSASYANGAVVILTPTSGTGYSFSGWSGTGVSCPDLSTCQITMNANTTVTATFKQNPQPLNLTIAGTAGGTVSSAPAGINCTTSCSGSFAAGTPVTLSAAASANSVFRGWSGDCAGTSTCLVTMSTTHNVTATFATSIATPLDDNNPAVAYNGWFDVADAAANGGFYRMSNVKGDKATWTSPATTSLTWVTRKGPDQGKASVTIDGTNEGTVDLYAATAASYSKLYSGLANGAHTVVVKALGTKNASSIGFNVRLDAFVVGTTTTQESDPGIVYGAWKLTAQALANGGSYHSATANTESATVRFTGASIDWITATGKGYGKASVTIDGVSKGTVDLYATAAHWQVKLSYAGLSSASHTMVIQVLGQKDTAATGAAVAVDGFIVHSS